MNETEQRIAIAEVCGWKWFQGMYHQGIRTDKAQSKLPDYLHDLNACHEMEKLLNGDFSKLATYHHWLAGIVVRGREGIGWLPNVEGYRWHATAPQRCEAFLRTIGKWKQ